MMSRGLFVLVLALLGFALPCMSQHFRPAVIVDNVNAIPSSHDTARYDEVSCLVLDHVCIPAMPFFFEAGLYFTRGLRDRGSNYPCID